MRGSRLATLVILVLWVLLGPVGMALSGCMMMDGCDALCSVPSFAPMVAAQGFLRVAWWMAAFPGAAIALAVLSLNLLGDGLNDALNPRGAL